MRGRNGRVGDFEIIRETASDGIGSRLELDLPSRRRTWIDYKSPHKVISSDFEGRLEKLWAIVDKKTWLFAGTNDLGN